MSEPSLVCSGGIQPCKSSMQSHPLSTPIRQRVPKHLSSAKRIQRLAALPRSAHVLSMDSLAALNILGSPIKTKKRLALVTATLARLRLSMKPQVALVLGPGSEVDHDVGLAALAGIDGGDGKLTGAEQVGKFARHAAVLYAQALIA
eukprot:9399685-Pyramimonas_sp.AAC.1